MPKGEGGGRGDGIGWRCCTGTSEGELPGCIMPGDGGGSKLELPCWSRNIASSVLIRCTAPAYRLVRWLRRAVNCR